MRKLTLVLILPNERRNDMSELMEIGKGLFVTALVVAFLAGIIAICIIYEIMEWHIRKSHKKEQK